MSRQMHRYSFYLDNSNSVEANLLTVIKQIQAPKREHEFIRRLMSNGYIVKNWFVRINRELPDIDNIAPLLNGQKKNELIFRPILVEGIPSLENSIVAEANRVKSRYERRHYFRMLFLYGFWFETTPDLTNLSALNFLAPTVEKTQTPDALNITQAVEANHQFPDIESTEPLFVNSHKSEKPKKYRSLY